MKLAERIIEAVTLDTDIPVGIKHVTMAWGPEENKKKAQAIIKKYEKSVTKLRKDLADLDFYEPGHEDK